MQNKKVRSLGKGVQSVPSKQDAIRQSKLLGAKSTGKTLSCLQAPLPSAGKQSSKFLHKMKQVNRKAKPGQNVRKEIKKLQKVVTLLIPKAPFARCMKRVVQSLSVRQGNQTNRAMLDSVWCMHEATESFMVRLMEDAQKAAFHAKRLTIYPKDINFARHMRGEIDSEELSKKIF